MLGSIAEFARAEALNNSVTTLGGPGTAEVAPEGRAGVVRVRRQGARADPRSAGFCPRRVNAFRRTHMYYSYSYYRLPE